jgi:hypothetical protein
MWAWFLCAEGIVFSLDVQGSVRAGDYLTSWANVSFSRKTAYRMGLTGKALHTDACFVYLHNIRVNVR